jgi:hypothetical protein
MIVRETYYYIGSDFYVFFKTIIINHIVSIIYVMILKRVYKSNY